MTMTSADGNLRSFPSELGRPAATTIPHDKHCKDFICSIAKGINLLRTLHQTHTVRKENDVHLRVEQLMSQLDRLTSEQ